MELSRKSLRPTLFFIDPETGEPAIFSRGKWPPMERLLEHAPTKVKEVFFFRFGKCKARLQRKPHSFILIGKAPFVDPLPDWVRLVEAMIKEKHGGLQFELRERFNESHKARACALKDSEPS